MANRTPFIAAVETVDLSSGKKVVALTSDLSRDSCRVSTTTPFEPGTYIELVIRDKGVTFKVKRTA